MSDPKPTVMFLEMPDEPTEDREVFTVPSVGEAIFAKGKRRTVVARDWQWDSSGRLRVVVLVRP